MDMIRQPFFYLGGPNCLTSPIFYLGHSDFILRTDTSKALQKPKIKLLSTRQVFFVGKSNHLTDRDYKVVAFIAYFNCLAVA